MIETTVNEILQGRIEVSGYWIYAVHDKQGQCLYVGYTENLYARMRRHIYDKSEWQEHLIEGDDLEVKVYDRDDVDRIALSKETGGKPRTFSNEKEWAKAAEWYMCHVLRPRINHRKTYKPLIDSTIKLCQYGTFSREEAYEEAVKILRDWNVTAKRFDEEEKAIRRRLGLDSPSDGGEAV
jgi:hypothetical protein